jgi:predicted enzyme related to lactoylglutathione lyase
MFLIACYVAAPAQQPKTAERASLRTSALKINVDHMDTALAFYVDKLGFEIADRNGYPRQVILKTGDRVKVILNMVARLQKAATTESQVSFTLQVNNLDQTIQKMRSLGVEFAKAKPRREGVGNAISILDPFGRIVSLMHQTSVRAEPFKEPRIYNYGVLIPDMAIGREFYSTRLGFIVRSEKYLPLDLPLGNEDNSLAFMLHYRPGITSIKKDQFGVSPFATMVFETSDLQGATRMMNKANIKVLAINKSTQGPTVVFEDPFGNVSELIEIGK